MASVITRKVQVISITLVKCSRSRPTQLIGGPGKMGKKLPIMPTIISIKPSVNKKISIV